MHTHNHPGRSKDRPAWQLRTVTLRYVRLGLALSRHGSCGKSAYGVSGSGTLGYVPLTCGRWGKSSSVSVSCVELWRCVAVKLWHVTLSRVLFCQCMVGQAKANRGLVCCVWAAWVSRGWCAEISRVTVRQTWWVVESSVTVRYVSVGQGKADKAW